MNLEDEIMELLQRERSHSLSLYQLHARLIAAIGPATGTYHELQARLKRMPARFCIVPRPDPLRCPLHWPGAVRESYLSALGHAGVDLSPVVTLVRHADEGHDIYVRMQTTLLALARNADDPGLREDLLTALTSPLPRA